MLRKLNRSISGFMIATLLVMGTLVAPIGPSGSSFLAPQKAEAAACTKYYYVIWNVAGVYNRPGGVVIDHRYIYNTVAGPSGVWYAGWTEIRVSLWDAPNGQAYMRSDALSYRGCW